jgi:C4-type Zn-finger protein
MYNDLKTWIQQHRGKCMSKFKFNCPHCEQRLGASDELFGKKIECPSCKGSIKHH